MKSGAQVVVEHLLGEKEAARIYAKLQSYAKHGCRRKYIRIKNFKVRYVEFSFPMRPGLIFSYRLEDDYRREARLAPKGIWQGNFDDFIWLGLAFILLKTKRIQQTAMRTGGCVVIKDIAKMWRGREVKVPWVRKRRRSRQGQPKGTR